MNLRYLVYIYKKIAYSDEYGGETIKYAKLSKEFASIEYVKGKEGEESKAQTATRVLNFVIRYREDINEGDIITYEDERGENDYNILSIEEYQKHGNKMYLIVQGKMSSNIIKKQNFTTINPAILLENGAPILNESYLEIYQG
jgi:SPP1 family predicted phage head-tail adaptor